MFPLWAHREGNEALEVVSNTSCWQGQSKRYLTTEGNLLRKSRRPNPQMTVRKSSTMFSSNDELSIWSVGQVVEISARTPCCRSLNTTFGWKSFRVQCSSLQTLCGRFTLSCTSTLSPRDIFSATTTAIKLPMCFLKPCSGYVSVIANAIAVPRQRLDPAEELRRVLAR